MYYTGHYSSCQLVLNVIVIVIMSIVIMSIFCRIKCLFVSSIDSCIEMHASNRITVHLVSYDCVCGSFTYMYMCVTVHCMCRSGTSGVHPQAVSPLQFHRMVRSHRGDAHLQTRLH